MFGIGFSEMLVLAIIALLVFGPKRLPEIGSAVGKGMREFKEAVNTHTTVMAAQGTTAEPNEATPVVTAAKEEHSK